MKILCIVHKLPPAVDGVGDYADLLALQLWSDSKIKMDFMVTTADWDVQRYQGPFKITVLKKWGKEELLEAILLVNPDKIFLNYVGYAYAKRGCPLWLVKALTGWKKSNPTKQLITFFHEMYAFGPIWTSQFWTLFLQVKIARDLINLSDVCCTSRDGYAKIIRRFLGHPKVPVLSMPVFSTIGEPPHLLPLNKRKRQMVIFGQERLRQRVYRLSNKELRKTCEMFNIENVIDIGPPLNLLKEEIEGLPIKFLGIQPQEEVSRIMQESMMGFLNYPLRYLAKSTIFAAYCAHGLLPVGVLNCPGDEDGLRMNQHYLTTQHLQEGVQWNELQLIAQQANNWYRGHCLIEQAKFFNNHLG